MGLFQFIKDLFGKATQLEAQVETFVKEVETKVPGETATNLRNDLNKVKKVKADTIAQVEKVEAKVKEVEAKVKKATTKAPKAPKASTAKKTTK